MNFLTEIKTLFQPILAGLAADPAKLADYLAMIKPAQNAEHGDYQANFAMPLAKVLKRKPPEVAAEIISKLPANDLIEAPSVAGPGFINLRLKNAWLASAIRTIGGDERIGIVPLVTPKTFVIDYSGPNVAKPLHVGHLRSTIIGEALSRLLRFLGHRVVGDNHLGDWGTQFGMLLYGYKNFRDEAAFKTDTLHELARLYKLVREHAKAKDDDDEGDANNPVAQAYRAETVKLHAGDPENVELWKCFMPACMAEIEAIYRRLDVKFDHMHGESFYHPMLPGIVEDLKKRGIAFDSDGAVVIPNAKGNVPRTTEEKLKEDPPALIQKRDGAFTYTTTDLATIKLRIEQFRPDTMLYVVDARQALHFRTLFAEAARWGYGNVSMQHTSFGSVLGDDGQPLKTREGNPVTLANLLDEAVIMGARKYEETLADRRSRNEDVPELSAEERNDIAETVGLGAVKYADLSQNRTSDYKFSFVKMLATDGNTATYMQYAYVRCRGIFRKAEIAAETLRATPPEVLLEMPAERALALQLLRWSEALDVAASEAMPNHLTSYLWDLAKAYSSFFVNCPVLKAETPALRDSRLLLCDLTARVIQKTLELLGIRTVERM